MTYIPSNAFRGFARLSALFVAPRFLRHFQVSSVNWLRMDYVFFRLHSLSRFRCFHICMRIVFLLSTLISQIFVKEQLHAVAVWDLYTVEIIAFLVRAQLDFEVSSHSLATSMGMRSETSISLQTLCHLCFFCMFLMSYMFVLHFAFCQNVER
jgi:hypothetical protein